LEKHHAKQRPYWFASDEAKEIAENVLLVPTRHWRMAKKHADAKETIGC
jgi:hypothetical protein